MEDAKRHQHPSGRLDQYVLRFPDGMRDWFKRQAKKNERSLNAEIIFTLKEKMSAATGEGLANTAPAAASSNNAALQGGASITNGS